MKCVSCQAELPEGSRFCGLCGARLAQDPPCPECGAPNPSDFHFCMGCGKALGGRGADSGKERRVVTVLFADVAGYTAMSESRDPEEVHRIMDGLFRLLAAEIRARGGVVDKYIGDAVMATFGAAAAHDDDAERAVDAALGMQAAVGRYSERLQASGGPSIRMRIGVHTGRVLAGAVGEGGAATVTGDTVNLAARLESACEIGSVLVSDQTYRALRGVFEVLPLLPVRVKGKSEPIPVYKVLRRKEGDDASMEIEIGVPLIGRRQEMGALLQLFEQAAEEAKASTALVVGPTGLGKSRLVAEVIQAAKRAREGTVVYRGRASWEGAQSGLFGPLAAAIRQAASIRRDTPPDEALAGLTAFAAKVVEQSGSQALTVPVLVDALVPVAGLRPSEELARRLKEGAEQVRREQAAALRLALQTLTRERPYILVFEDLHLANPSALHLLAEFAAGAKEGRYLLIGLAREESALPEGLREAAELLRLGTLSEENIGELVRSLLWKVPEIPEKLLREIARRAGGNPLFAEEIVRHLTDLNVLVADSEGLPCEVRLEQLDHMEVPDALAAILQSRADALPLNERAALRAACVCGEHVYSEAVSELLGRPTVDVLASLERRGFLQHVARGEVRAGADFRFVHLLLQETLYASMTSPERRAGHLKIAGWLEKLAAQEPGALAEAGRHLEAAGAWAEAIERYRRAAAAAKERYALREAVALLRQALGCLPKLTQLPEVDLKRERFGLSSEMEQLFDVLGDRTAQAAVLDSLEKDFDGVASAGQADLLLRRSQWAFSCRRYAESQQLAQRALEDRSSQAEPLLHARALSLLGASEFCQGASRDAMTHYQEAVELQRAHGDELGKARSLNWLAVATWQEGDIAKAIQLAKEGVETCNLVGDRGTLAKTLGNLGLFHHTSGALREAHAFYQRATDVGSFGNPTFAVLSAYNLGEVERLLGQLEMAEHHYLEAEASGRDAQIVDIAELAGSQLGLIFQQYGRLNEAIALHQAGLESAIRRSDYRNVALCAAALCRVRLAQKANGEALMLARESQAAAARLDLRSDDVLARCLEVEALSGLGQPTSDLELTIDRARPRAAHWAQVEAALALSLARMAAGDFRLAVRFADEAVALCRQSGMVLSEMEALLRRARSRKMLSGGGSSVEQDLLDARRICAEVAALSADAEAFRQKWEQRWATEVGAKL